MTTVAAISKTAFDAVAAAITDVVLDATLTSGGTGYTGRVVVDGETASTEFPKFTPSASARRVIMEGFSAAPADGDNLSIDGTDWLVLRVINVVEAGGLYTVQAVKASEMWNATVSLQAVTQTPDGMGGYTEAWSTPTAVNCYLEGIGGQERWEAMRVAAGNRWRCIIAYQAGVTEANRAVIGSKTYNIEAAQDMGGRGVWLEMILTDGAS